MIEFRAYGAPIPQGSKQVVRGSRLIDASPAPLRAWRQHVAAHALEAMAGHTRLDGPVRLALTFYLARPKAHYRTGRFAHLLREDAPVYVATKPDLDKIVRAIGDALTDAEVWRDDAQAAVIHTSKRYAPDGSTQGVVVRVSPLPITE